MKLGRCVVGIKMQIGFEDGCGVSRGWCDPIARNIRYVFILTDSNRVYLTIYHYQHVLSL